MTNHANHHETFSHDAINRYLKNDTITADDIWNNIKNDILQSDEGCLVFDDTVIDKNHSFEIELVKRQYSGNVHGLIKGIGLVNCIYVNPKTEQYWIIDYRIYDADGDGKTKLQHAKEMLIDAVEKKRIAFTTVLMDTWYASKDALLHIESLGKIYYCPIRENRKVDDSGGLQPYTHASNVEWHEGSEYYGKIVKIHGFPKEHKVRLFRVANNTRTDYIVTNDTHQTLKGVAQIKCKLRWKIEQFHREIKQLTGVEKCQARKAIIQKNHIACAILVWQRLCKLAQQLGKTMYQIKHGLLSDYLCKELAKPSISMAFA